MFSTLGRQNCLRGLLIGSAYAESVAISYPLLRLSTAKQIVRAEGGTLLSWRLHTIGSDTQLAIMSGQAILNSGNELKDFQNSFLGRLCWLPFGMSLSLGVANRWAAAVGWLRTLRVPSGFRSTENSPLARTMMVALCLHGTGHNLTKWIEGTVRLTHTHPDTIDACLVIAAIAQSAGRSEPGKLDCSTVLARVTQLCKQQSTKDLWKDLGNHLKKGASPRAYNKHLNSLRLSRNGVVRTSLVSAYCFLSLPTDFSKAVGAVMTLGGDRKSCCAIVGGLVGIHVGFEGLPNAVRQSRFLLPHGANWMNRLSRRLAEWPHGPEDLNWAPSFYSWPFLQLVRNLLTHVLTGLRLLRDIPMKFID